MESHEGVNLCKCGEPGIVRGSEGVFCSDCWGELLLELYEKKTCRVKKNKAAVIHDRQEE